MKRFTQLLAVVLMVFATTATVQANPEINDELTVETLKQNEANFVKKEQWQGFSKNLVVALKSENEGLQVAAMGMVIRYGEQVNVKNAVFDVMSVYRNHENEDMRRMALVTLGQMESKWAMDFLSRAERFEKSETLRHTIQAVVKDYNDRHNS